MSSSGGPPIIIHNSKTNGPGAGKKAHITEAELELLVLKLPDGTLKAELEALLKD